MKESTAVIRFQCDNGFAVQVREVVNDSGPGLPIVEIFDGPRALSIEERRGLASTIAEYLEALNANESTSEAPETVNRKLNMFVEEIGVSVRAQNCMKNASLQFVGELVQKTEQDLIRTRCFGRKSLKEIKDALSKMKLSLGIPMDPFVKIWAASHREV